MSVMKIKIARICFLLNVSLLYISFQGVRFRLQEWAGSRGCFALGWKRFGEEESWEMEFCEAFRLPYLYCMCEGALCQTGGRFIRRIERRVLPGQHRGGF